MRFRVISDGDEYTCAEIANKGTKVVLETENKVARIDVLESGGFHIEVEDRQAPTLSAVPDAS